jgi:hypothetical protein
METPLKFDVRVRSDVGRADMRLLTRKLRRREHCLLVGKVLLALNVDEC